MADGAATAEAGGAAPAPAPADGIRASEEEFHIDRIIALFRRFGPDAEGRSYYRDLPWTWFREACEETAKMTYKMGTAFSFAGGDINAKISHCEARLAEITERLGGEEAFQVPIPDQVKGEERKALLEQPRKTVQWIIADEIKRDAQAIENGRNSSFAVEAARLLWFMDFITVMVTELLKDQAAELKPCCEEAYRRSLQPHHRWILQQTILTAMMLVPYRSRFLQDAGRGNSAGVLDKMRDTVPYVQRLRKALWKYYDDTDCQALSGADKRDRGFDLED